MAPHAEHAARRAHGAYFTTKPSVPPGLVSRPPPRSAATEKYPAISALPLPSAATARPESSYPSPARRDHRYAPAAEVGQQAAANVDGAREAARHDHVAAPIERDAGGPVLTRAPEAPRPQGRPIR